MLRCDRNEPCSSCEIRNQDCVYTQAPLPNHKRRDGKQVNQSLKRIRRLEELVTSLASRNDLSSSEAETSSRDSSAGVCMYQQSIKHENVNKDGLTENLESKKYNTGRIQVNGGQPVYISGSSWSAIRDEVSSYLPSLCSFEGSE